MTVATAHAPPLPTLTIWDDPEPRDGAMNMALDEALLRSVSQPVLRVYRWREKTVSIGCFVSLLEARAAFGPEWAFVRRWTGGGVVAHDRDWTYSLIVPSELPLCRSPAAASYPIIHGALTSALRRGGIDAKLAPAAPAGLGGLCFSTAVAADVVVEGIKIAGAAQRRTRLGLLHQGSVQGVVVRAGTAAEMAAHLGSEAPSCFIPSPRLLAAAGALCTEKYSSREWLHRIA